MRVSLRSSREFEWIEFDQTLTNSVTENKIYILLQGLLNYELLHQLVLLQSYIISCYKSVIDTIAKSYNIVVKTDLKLKMNSSNFIKR